MQNILSQSSGRKIDLYARSLDVDVITVKSFEQDTINTTYAKVGGYLDNFELNPITITDLSRTTAGIVGPKGPKGYTGDRGPVGDQGPIGLVGIDGYIGSEGLRGATGSIGLTGLKGIKGIKGPIGEDGEVGDVGDVGLQGDKGDPNDTLSPGGISASSGGTFSTSSLRGWNQSSAGFYYYKPTDSIYSINMYHHQKGNFTNWFYTHTVGTGKPTNYSRCLLMDNYCNVDPTVDHWLIALRDIEGFTPTVQPTMFYGHYNTALARNILHGVTHLNNGIRMFCPLIDDRTPVRNDTVANFRAWVQTNDVNPVFMFSNYINNIFLNARFQLMTFDYVETLTTPITHVFSPLP